MSAWVCCAPLCSSLPCSISCCHCSASAWAMYGCRSGDSAKSPSLAAVASELSLDLNLIDVYENSFVAADGVADASGVTDELRGLCLSPLFSRMTSAMALFTASPTMDSRRPRSCGLSPLASFSVPRRSIDRSQSLSLRTSPSGVTPNCALAELVASIVIMTRTANKSLRGTLVMVCS